MRKRPVHALTCLLALSLTAEAAGQGLPTEPVSLGGGRIVLGAEITATAAPEDPGFFNYTNYEYSALRNVRVSVGAEVRAHPRLQLLGELRFDQGRVLQPYGFYARIRPWPAKRFDLQVGRVPPTFGAFARRGYAADNLLIGVPLAYQYLTSLRADAVAANVDELLRMRARGWLTNFSVGNLAAEQGLPLVNGFRWDTGVQAHGVANHIEWTAAVTTGSLSNPRVDDDNRGRQVAGRVAWRPVPSVVAGLSVARGAFLNRRLARAITGITVEDMTQRALGADVEYSVGRALIRSEWIRSRWSLPAVEAPALDEPLDATSLLVEGRYRFWPGVYAAARAERLGFSAVTGTTQRLEWDAPVVRYEVGIGWSVTRNVVLKSSWQRNERDGGRVRHESLGAVQLLYWF
ncbi:MAG: hypothetical protein ABR606_17195 [Vicinamibacterales bacterium]